MIHSLACYHHVTQIFLLDLPLGAQKRTQNLLKNLRTLNHQNSGNSTLRNARSPTNSGGSTITSWRTLESSTLHQQIKTWTLLQATLNVRNMKVKETTSKPTVGDLTLGNSSASTQERNPASSGTASSRRRYSRKRKSRTAIYVKSSVPMPYIHASVLPLNNTRTTS